MQEPQVRVVVYMPVVRQGKLLLVRYKVPPNRRNCPGWWILSPGVDFGGHPKETAQKELNSVGLGDESPTLHKVESFVLPKGTWHLVFHYSLHINRDIIPGLNILDYGWFSLDSLPEEGEFSHGSWERNLAIQALARTRGFN